MAGSETIATKTLAEVGYSNEVFRFKLEPSLNDLNETTAKEYRNV